MGKYRGVAAGVVLVLLGSLLWFSQATPLKAEPIEAKVEVVADPESVVSLTMSDGSVDLGSAKAGETVSDAIKGAVRCSGKWRLAYAATDFTSGDSAIPISNASISGTGIDGQVILDSSGIIYDEMDPTGQDAEFDFEHTFSLHVPDYAMPGQYTATIQYTLTALPK